MWEKGKTEEAAAAAALVPSQEAGNPTDTIDSCARSRCGYTCLKPLLPPFSYSIPQPLFSTTPRTLQLVPALPLHPHRLFRPTPVRLNQLEAWHNLFSALFLSHSLWVNIRTTDFRYEVGSDTILGGNSKRWRLPSRELLLAEESRASLRIGM